MSAYLSSLTPVFTRHTYALRESIDASRSSTKAIGLAAESQCCCRSPPRFASHVAFFDPSPAEQRKRGGKPFFGDTLFFSLQDLDSTKPAGSVKIRIETIAYYLKQSSASVMERKKQRLTGPGPLI
jgi:hypothetical protein